MGKELFSQQNIKECKIVTVMATRLFECRQFDIFLWKPSDGASNVWHIVPLVERREFSFATLDAIRHALHLLNIDKAIARLPWNIKINALLQKAASVFFREYCNEFQPNENHFRKAVSLYYTL